MAGMEDHAHELTRRRLLALGLAVPPLAVLARYADLFGTEDAEAALPLAATPAIADDEPTPELTEGPYFTPNSPLRRTILPAGAAGTRLALTGRVLTTAGKPVAHALVDFWQANAAGAYDNSGYRFRGHQFTDARGRYSLLTVVPGIYPGRTKHIHVKAQAPHKSILTTQLFFPGVPRNASDNIFTPECLVSGWRVSGGKRLARFDFVLDI
jgi:protocatechuate 3,4-dioxygenase beta subunit